jgi:hypothetical protein
MNEKQTQYHSNWLRLSLEHDHWVLFLILPKYKPTKKNKKHHLFLILPKPKSPLQQQISCSNVPGMHTILSLALTIQSTGCRTRSVLQFPPSRNKSREHMTTPTSLDVPSKIHWRKTLNPKLLNVVCPARVKKKMAYVLCPARVKKIASESSGHQGATQIFSQSRKRINRQIWNDK